MFFLLRVATQASAGRPYCGGGDEVEGALRLLQWIPRRRSRLRQCLRHISAQARTGWDLAGGHHVGDTFLYLGTSDATHHSDSP